jgi:uncharacterized protein with PIN domain
MIVDPSAMLAVVLAEEDAERYARAMLAACTLLPAPSASTEVDHEHAHALVVGVLIASDRGSGIDLRRRGNESSRAPTAPWDGQPTPP